MNVTQRVELVDHNQQLRWAMLTYEVTVERGYTRYFLQAIAWDDQAVVLRLESRGETRLPSADQWNSQWWS
jgi:hypothetical protein